MSVNSVLYQGYEERVFEAERSSHSECRVEAAQQSSKQDELADVRLHGETSQVETKCCQILCIVQGILTQHTAEKHTFLATYCSTTERSTNIKSL